MNGTNVRTYEAHCARTNERMARSLLSLFFLLCCSPVRLRAFKLDRVQVRPMADVAKLPCDSGFTLSRLVRLAVTLSPFLSQFLSARNGSANEKNGEIGRVTGVARVSYFRFSSHDRINKYDWSFVNIYFRFRERNKGSVKLRLKLIDNGEDWSKSVVIN